MIEIIAEALLELEGGSLDEREEVRDVTLFSRLKTANVALKAAEQAGMNPPYSDDPYICDYSWEPASIDPKHAEHVSDALDDYMERLKNKP